MLKQEDSTWGSAHRNRFYHHDSLPAVFLQYGEFHAGQTGVLIQGHSGTPGLSATPEGLQVHQTVLHSAVCQLYYPAAASRIWLSLWKS